MVQNFGDDANVNNVMHLLVDEDGPYLGADLNTAAATFYGLFTDAFAPSVCSALTFARCDVKDVSVSDGAVGTHVPSEPVAGTVSTAPLPANCALVVSWKEEISYRGGHPRTYLCAIPGADVLDPQHVSSAYAVGVQNAAEDFRSSVFDATWPTSWGSGSLAVVHYRLDDVALTPPHVKILTQAIVNTRLDSQRRRLQR
jgi:hypothetical protein